LVVADDMGWADIGYHNPKLRTPVLDELARTGVELDCHYVQPQCTPTRVALMTGRYPSRFGPHCTQASNDQAYPIGTLTMASMLKSLGYETALMGKWHMGSKPEWGPNHHGFDHSYGSLAGASGMYDHRYRLNTPYWRTWHRNHEFVEEVGHVTDLVTDEAVKWIQKKRQRPFFLYVPYQNVHTPLVESHRLIALYDHIENPDRRLMAAAITHLDRCIGRIVEAIDQSAQREDTLIIFFSDNGGIHGSYGGNNYPPPDPPLKDFSFNTPLRSGKSHVYEGGMRVPALVNWSGTLKPRKVDAPMHCVDWMPTLASLLGFTPSDEPQWDGHNVWPAVTGQERGDRDRQLYWVWGSKRNRVALRRGPWKILRDDPKAEWELYNVEDDPGEQTNLARKRPEKMQQLRRLFEQEKAKDAL
jgi:arylsulfatase A-like enzyme